MNRFITIAIDGGAGVDRLVGGKGDDYYYIKGRDIVIEKANSGEDTINSVVDYTLPEHFENLTFSMATSPRKGTGNSANNKITGSRTHDKLLGLAGNDTLMGGEGNDTLNGDSGDDKIVVKTGGVSTVNGGSGFDVLYIDTSGLTETQLTSNSGCSTSTCSVTYTDGTSGSVDVSGIETIVTKNIRFDVDN